MSTIKLAIVCLVSVLGVFVLLNAPTTYAAFDPLADACATNSNSTACKESKNKSDRIAGSKGIISTVTNIVGAFAGVLAVIMIVFAGIMLATAGGDQAKVTKARSMILGSVIGLVVVALAWTITTFIISRFVI